MQTWHSGQRVHKALTLLQKGKKAGLMGATSQQSDDYRK